MENHQTNFSGRKSLLIYILLSFGITWLCWISSIIFAEKNGYLLPTPTSIGQVLESGFENSKHASISLLFNAAVYGPLIGAFVVTALNTGKDGVVDLLNRILKWRVNVKWYAIAIGLVLTITLVPLILGKLTGQMQAGEGTTSWSLLIITLIFLRQVLTSGLGEEPGWRGFLLPHLQSGPNRDRAVWILGIIWAVWHFPFTIYYTVSGMSDIPIQGVILTVVLALAGQTMSLIGMSYIYTWIYNNTKSVFLAIIFHALSNFLPAVLLVGLNPSLGIVTALMPWVVVFILEKVL